jgi:hypothetical protein
VLAQIFWSLAHNCAKVWDMSIRGFALGLIFVAVTTSAAQAYENYIPLGAGYSSTVDTLPQFDSDAGQISQQTDIYETEQYKRNRKQAEEDSRMRAFFSDRNSTGVDNSIDY